jgi:hypothetical protein
MEFEPLHLSVYQQDERKHKQPSLNSSLFQAIQNNIILFFIENNGLYSWMEWTPEGQSMLTWSNCGPTRRASCKGQVTRTLGNDSGDSEIR